jgi:hydroxymethylpyrimidine pyrophosphatase-like HAD family hydrolase
MATSKRVIALFDVDGTLTPARKVVSAEVLEFLSALRGKITIGFVGGSDLKKQKEQLGENGNQPNHEKKYLTYFHVFAFLDETNFKLSIVMQMKFKKKCWICSTIASLRMVW